MSYALIENDVIQLCCAVRMGDISVVRMLLDTGVDIDGQDINGETALHTAVFNEDEDIVEELIKSAADVNISNNNGQTPLHIAANHGYSDCAKILLAAEANTETTTKYTGMTALHLASKNGHTPIVRMLVEHGVNIDAEDNIKKTADFYVSGSDIVDILNSERKFFQTESKSNDDKEEESNLMKKYLNTNRVKGKQPEEDILNKLPNSETNSTDFVKEDSLHRTTEKEKSTMLNTKAIAATETQIKHATSKQTTVRPTLQTKKHSEANMNSLTTVKQNMVPPTSQRSKKFGATSRVQKPRTNQTSLQNRQVQKPGNIQFSQHHEKMMQMNVFDRLTRKRGHLKK